MDDHRPTLPLDWLTEVPTIGTWFSEEGPNPIPLTKGTMAEIGRIAEPYRNAIKTVLFEFCPGFSLSDIRPFASPGLGRGRKAAAGNYIVDFTVEAFRSYPTVKANLDADLHIFEPVMDVLAHLFPDQPLRGTILETQESRDAREVPENEHHLWNFYDSPRKARPSGEHNNAVKLSVRLEITASNDVFLIEEKVEQLKSIIDDLHNRLASASQAGR